MWNTTVGEVAPSLRFRTKHSVAGLVAKAGPMVGWRDLLTGRYQRSVSETIGLNSPLYKPAIRWKAEAYYALLGTSPSPNIVVGRGRELFEQTYLQEYCRRSLATMLPLAEASAESIQRIQDFYEARGQAFLYLITPSKAAALPDRLPAGYRCPAPLADRRDKLQAYRAVLGRHGVHYLDAASLVETDYPGEVFPRGGTHWNQLGATIAAAALTDAINRAAGQTLLTPFRFSWKIKYVPRESDRDLLDLLNLPWPDDYYPVAVVNARAKTRAECRPAEITAVGGSFLFELDQALEAVACPPVIHDWFYWDQKHFVYANGGREQRPIDAAERSRDLLDQLDVLILEENEAALPGSGHLAQLRDFVAAQATTAR